MKNQAKEMYIKKEFNKYEKASGSKDPQNYDREDPETTRPPKGKRGRPPLNKPKHAKNIERTMKQEYERGFQEIEKSNLHSTEVAALQTKRLKTIAK